MSVTPAAVPWEFAAAHPAEQQVGVQGAFEAIQTVTGDATGGVVRGIFNEPALNPLTTQRCYLYTRLDITIGIILTAAVVGVVAVIPRQLIVTAAANVGFNWRFENVALSGPAALQGGGSIGDALRRLGWMLPDARGRVTQVHDVRAACPNVDTQTMTMRLRGVYVDWTPGAVLPDLGRLAMV